MPRSGTQSPLRRPNWNMPSVESEACRKFIGHTRITVWSKLCGLLGLFTVCLNRIKQSNWAFEFRCWITENWKGFFAERREYLPFSSTSFRRKCHLLLRFKSSSLRSPPRPHASLPLCHPQCIRATCATIFWLISGSHVTKVWRSFEARGSSWSGCPRTLAEHGPWIW